MKKITFVVLASLFFLSACQTYPDSYYVQTISNEVTLSTTEVAKDYIDNPEGNKYSGLSVDDHSISFSFNEDVRSYMLVQERIGSYKIYCYETKFIAYDDESVLNSILMQAETKYKFVDQTDCEDYTVNTYSADGLDFLITYGSRFQDSEFVEGTVESHYLKIYFVGAYNYVNSLLS